MSLVTLIACSLALTLGGLGLLTRIFDDNRKPTPYHRRQPDEDQEQEVTP